MKGESTVDLPNLKEDGYSFADNCFKRVEVAEGGIDNPLIPP